MYKSFRIQKFRGIKDLELVGLDKFNIITGMNNVGKTAVLEAFFLHLGRMNPGLLINIDKFRGLDKDISPFAPWINTPWTHIFYNLDKDEEITLSGTEENNQDCVVTYRPVNDPKVLSRLSGVVKYEKGKSRRNTGGGTVNYSPIKAIELINSQDKEPHYLILNREGMKIYPEVPSTRVTGVFRPASWIEHAATDAARYSKIKEQKKDKDVLEIVKRIDNRIQSLDVVYMGEIPILYVDIGLPRLIPINYLGEGTRRFVSCVLSISEARGGVVLIDEIENGLHHTIYNLVWNAITEAANVFNTQIIATTHSLEFIKNTSVETDQNKPNYLLYRLERENGNVTSKRVAANTLVAGLEMGLEVR